LIGDNLFRPTERDLVTVGAAIRRLNLRVTSSLVAASVAINTPAVPNDEVWLITQVYVQTTPGAAQTQTNGVVSIVQAGVSFNEIAGWSAQDFSATPAIPQVKFLVGVNVAMMPAEVLRFTGTFNAGANANLVLLNLIGFALPRGNLI
jgi:hypothetical protein